MLGGVSLVASEIPIALIGAYGLQSRVHDRGGAKEIFFLIRDRMRILPVWLNGQFQIMRWGAHRGQSKKLPHTAWTQRESLEQGKWILFCPEEAMIPTTFGYDGGVWYPIKQGIKAI